jgi:hypothetical protein
MRARSLLLGTLVAVNLVAVADVSWAGAGRATAYPWTGTGNQYGRQGQPAWQGNRNHDGGWNQRDRVAWNGHGHHEGCFNQGDRDSCKGNAPRSAWNDDRDDRGQQERPKPPWGGPLGEGGHLGW